MTHVQEKDSREMLPCLSPEEFSALPFCAEGVVCGLRWKRVMTLQFAESSAIVFEVVIKREIHEMVLSGGSSAFLINWFWYLGCV